MVAVAVEFAASLADPWQAITCQVFGAGWNRGSDSDRGVFALPEAGEASVFLVDPDRDLDPANAAGVFFGAIDVGVPFRISLAGAVAFTGRIETIHHELVPSNGIPLARINAVDPIAKLASVQADWTALPAESSSARITRILDAAEVTLRDVQTGGVQLQVHAAEQTDAWSLIVGVVQDELGAVEIRPDGTLVFRIRSTTWASSPPVLHLGCGGDALPLSELTMEQTRSSIRNRISALRVGSATTNVFYSPSSVARYGLRSISRTDIELTSDSATMQWAQFVGSRSDKPTRAYQGVEVPRATAAQVAAIEAVPLYTGRVHVTIDEWGPPIDVTLRLLGVGWEVDDTGTPTASLVLGTDWPLGPVGRSVVLDTDTQWLTAFPGGSGALYWKIDTGTLKVASSPVGFGGFASWILTWTSLGAFLAGDFPNAEDRPGVVQPIAPESTNGE